MWVVSWPRWRNRASSMKQIVVFTSDHGEWLGEHLRYGKGYPAPDVVSRVPLIIDAPGTPAGGYYDGLIEAVDIVPTLLELAAIPQPSIMQGESLAGPLRGEADTRRKEAALTEGAGWKSLRTASVSVSDSRRWARMPLGSGARCGRLP